jgi:hypothetical protein
MLSPDPPVMTSKKATFLKSSALLFAMVMFHTADCADPASLERTFLLNDLVTTGKPITDTVVGAEVMGFTLDVSVKGSFVCRPLPIAVTNTVYKQLVLAGIAPLLNVMVVAVFPMPVQPGVATMVPGDMVKPLGNKSVKNAFVMAYGNEFTTEIVTLVESPIRTESEPNAFDKGLATTKIVAWLDEAAGRLDETTKGGFVWPPVAVALTET